MTPPVPRPSLVTSAGGDVPIGFVHEPASALARSDARRTRSAILGRFLLLSWLLLLLNASAYLAHVEVRSALAGFYVAAMFLTYPAMYLAPIALLLVLLNRALAWGPVARFAGRVTAGLHVEPTTLLFGLAVLLAAALQLVIFADTVIVRMYGYHLNGFVWNLLKTPGGIESMGAGSSTYVSFALLALGSLVLEALLMLLALRHRRFAHGCMLLSSRKARWGLLAGLMLLSTSERLCYGIADAANFPTVVTAAGTFPFYQPLRMHKLAGLLGFKADREQSVRMKSDPLNLRYPLEPIVRAPGSRNWNIVWLVSESLRADMLDPEIMPATSAFAARSLDFRNHYSAGNGTRMGMFGMFYGLYGSYWFAFLNETRAPVICGALRAADYDFQLYTSAKFTFPEFSETLFAEVPAERMHEGDDKLEGWQNDRLNVSALLDSIDTRPADKPFFRFMFFESPHAQYNFPPESVIRTPYLEDMNYATMDLEGDIGLIKNRYINACHHLDSQLQRVLDGLSERGLLDSTIVVITGDHGEEFMEKGHWGHHSSFAEEQTRTPFVLWVPGQQPARISWMSSHLDIAPTLMSLLGVTNPPDDYSLGCDLLPAVRADPGGSGAGPRTETVIADWDSLACVDAQTKGVFPVNRGGFTGFTVTTANDAPVDDPDAWVAANAERLQRVARELSRFSK